MPYNGIIKWDGSEYHYVPVIPTYDSYVFICAMAVYKGELYASGNFGMTTTDRNIARWDGVQWKSVGGGLHGPMDGVESLVVYKSYLYIAGYFTKADGNTGNRIAKWDGEQWSEVGGGVNGSIRDMIVYNDELWVGGTFSYAGGIPANRVAKWNGEKWCSLDSELNGNVTYFGIYNDDIYVLGSFEQCGPSDYSYVAEWIGGDYVNSCSVPSGINYQTLTGMNINISPNPFSTYTILNVPKALINATFTIFDILGNEIKRKQNLNGSQITITRDGLSGGMYLFYVTDSNGLIGTGKIIVE
jgi:hypothetical protein